MSSRILSIGTMELKLYHTKQQKICISILIHLVQPFYNLYKRTPKRSSTRKTHNASLILFAKIQNRYLHKEENRHSLLDKEVLECSPSRILYKGSVYVQCTLTKSIEFAQNCPYIMAFALYRPVGICNFFVERNFGGDPAFDSIRSGIIVDQFVLGVLD